MSAEDERYMALALMLGRRCQGQTWPNPAIGCVIVRDGRIVGRGWTAPGGRPHAETQALAQAGQKARGATAYVTLEPCSHHGQTPPCAEALVEAGIACVVAPFADSDGRVAGRGFAFLQRAGVDLRHAVLADQAARDLQGFLLRTEQGRPHLTLKLAGSFDGRIATATGQSQWITGPEARRHVHALRACHDAVMVGAGTARSDDPSLTVRGLGISAQPVRVVVSRRLDLPLMSKLARRAGEAPVWLCHGPDADPALIETWQGIGATLLACDLTGRQLDMRSVLHRLGEQGLTRVFCEGGSSLAASLLSAGLVDELVNYSAGMAIGAEGLPSVGALGLEGLADAPRFRLVENRAIGGDILQRWLRL